MLTQFLLLSLLLSLSTVTTAADDASVMSAFLSSITPPPDTWTTTTAYCTWKGVGCDNNNRVTSINLQSKSLAGKLPANLNSLSQLVSLSLQNNHFSGEIPSLSNLDSLTTLMLNSNNFTSVANAAFSALTNLQTFSISDNGGLNPWVFPVELSNSTNLVSIFANNANIVGPIPNIFGSFPSLTDLLLSYNGLNGSLPGSLNGSSIQTLWVNNQGLAGSLDVLSGMIELKQVWVHENRFSGEIPDLSNCISIFDLQLRDNQLTGIVPNSVISLPSLLNVTLQNNRLQGPLPSFPKNVVHVLLSNNRFCRNVSGDCDPQVSILLECVAGFGYPLKLADDWDGNNACASWFGISCDGSGNVVIVNLAKQGFSGTISPAFAKLSSLRELNLNGNNLTGKIPESLTNLTHITKIDVSHNNLVGKLPGFRKGIIVDTSGNPLFGTEPVSPGKSPGSGGESTGGGSGGGKNGSSGSVGMVVGVVIGVLCFVMVVMFVLYKCYKKKSHMEFGVVRNHEVGYEMPKIDVARPGNGYPCASSELHSQSSNEPSEFAVFEGGNVAISIQVLRQVTNNFSEDNILGRGGFGVVYKGELHDGTKIAVKRMESGVMGTKGMNEFQAEIGVLTKVRHRHLVALLGFCVNGNERLLVYEYMPKGHLGQHLFEWQEHNYPPLSWKQRVTIALDVARGVEYLHSLAQTSFIHRDLKPSNILLGDDMRAKVADFGLVKNAPDGKYSVETRLAGTFGYLAPEYAVTGRVTTKIDVFAFGVILMELITGRKALDESMPDESSHLVTWFRRILINKENLRKSIDGVLDPDDETYEIICRVAELAGHCTAREPHQRPDMGHVVNVLGPLVEQWKPSHQEDEDSYGANLQMSLPQALMRWQADEGSSSMISDMSFSRTQGSIPAKPSGFADSFDSMDCR
ncbi:hypothetical protein RND81_14G048800 [Saponaria officinalis]|uniref:non-specific serine/threonine protein kinase n=1 Tax=Saponaria officinalis TaxID=3572 RepID=A0AAW1GL61_SAPOF